MANKDVARDHVEMTDAELDAELDAAVAERKRSGRPIRQLGEWGGGEMERTVPISIRVPAQLLVLDLGAQ